MDRAQFAFDWIDKIEASGDPVALVDRLSEAAGTFGFTACAIATIPDDNKRFEQFQYVKRWPPGWFEHYVAHDYLAADPVVYQLRSSIRPFAWHEAVGDPRLHERSSLLMCEAAEFGLRSGFTVPSSSNSGESVAITFGGRDVELDEAGRRALYLISIWSHMRIREIMGPRPVRPRLSPRETEVLKWAAAGFRSAQIADRLQLSTETVETHIRNACRKLDVVTRTQAAARAMRFGII